MNNSILNLLKDDEKKSSFFNRLFSWSSIREWYSKQFKLKQKQNTNAKRLLPNKLNASIETIDEIIDISYQSTGLVMRLPEDNTFNTTFNAAGSVRYRETLV